MSGGNDELLSTLSLLCTVGYFTENLLKCYKVIISEFQHEQVEKGDAKTAEVVSISRLSTAQYLLSENIILKSLEYTLDRTQIIGHNLEVEFLRKYNTQFVQEEGNDKNQISFVLFSIERAINSVQTCIANLKKQ